MMEIVESCGSILKASYLLSCSSSTRLLINVLAVKRFVYVGIEVEHSLK